MGLIIRDAQRLCKSLNVPHMHDDAVSAMLERYFHAVRKLYTGRVRLSSYIHAGALRYAKRCLIDLIRGMHVPQWREGTGYISPIMHPGHLVGWEELFAAPEDPERLSLEWSQILAVVGKLKHDILWLTYVEGWLQKDIAKHYGKYRTWVHDQVNDALQLLRRAVLERRILRHGS